MLLSGILLNIILMSESHLNVIFLRSFCRMSFFRVPFSGKTFCWLSFWERHSADCHSSECCGIQINSLSQWYHKQWSLLGALPSDPTFHHFTNLKKYWTQNIPFKKRFYFPKEHFCNKNLQERVTPKFSINRTACIRHQCRKTTVLSCHRCLINSGVEKEQHINTD